MSSPILDMENINMRLGPSNMGRCGNGRGVHFGGVTMHPLTVLHPIHGTVNFTYFCYVLLVTWCHRVLLSCYLRLK